MNSMATIAVSSILSAVLAGGLVWSFSSQDEQGLTTDTSDISRGLGVVQDRLASMDQRLANMERSEVTTEQFRALNAAFVELRTRYDDLESMNTAATAERPASIGENGELVPVDEPTAAFIQQKIDDAVSKERKRSRKTQFERAAPFIKMGMQRQIKKMTDKMELRKDQEERLTKSMNDTFDELFPRLMTTMDSSATDEEKEAARAEITAALEAADLEAQSYLDHEKYQQYQELNAESRSGLNMFMGGGASGGSGTWGGGSVGNGNN